MLAGIFVTKKRAACLATLRANKRRRAGRREPDQSGFAQLTERRQAQPTPPPDPRWIELTQAIRNRAAALRSRPVELSLKLLRIGRRSHCRRCFRCRRRHIAARRGCLVMMAAMMMGRARRCVRGRHARLSRRCCHARLSRWCCRRGLCESWHRHRGGEESCGED
jgi:hypothetical protein